MYYSPEDSIEFLEQAWGGAKRLNHNSDILEALGITGDDTGEIIALYSKRFGVDISSYRWYFHTEEEIGIANIFYAAPYQKLGGRIPITPTMLADFANKGFWDINYPEHEFPFKKERAAKNAARYIILALISGLALLALYLFAQAI